MAYTGLTKNLITLWYIFRLKYKYQLLLIVVISLLLSLFELVLIGLTFPLINVLLNSNDSLVSANSFLNTFNFIGNHKISLCLIFIIVIIITFSLKILSTFSTTYLSSYIGLYISNKIYKTYLNESFLKNQQRNSSDIINTLTQKNNFVINNIVLQSLIFIGTFLTLFIMLIVFTFINPLVTFTSLIYFASLYFFIIRTTRAKLIKNSMIITIYSSKIIKEIQHSLVYFRDTILNNSYKFHLDRYYSYEKSLREAIGNSAFLSLLPRHLLESLILITITSFIIVLEINSSSEINLFSIVGVFAIIALRILPFVQQLYMSFCAIVGSASALSDVIEILNMPPKTSGNYSISNQSFVDHEIEITFNNVTFAYDVNDDNVIDNISFKIKKGDFVSIVGKSGVGKSTLIDLLMGILIPDSGTIHVGEHILNITNIPNWQNKLSYVSQNFIIYEGSLLENICLGINDHDIDINRVNNVALQCDLSSMFGYSEDFLNMQILENGSNLSGGQKQKVAIARALYKNSSIIILDEPTSSMDSESEYEILDLLSNLPNNPIIIIVTHSVVPIEFSNKVFELKKNVFGVNVLEVNNR